MINASNLNFSENPQDDSYFYNRNDHKLQSGDHLIAICEHFNINVGEINDDDFYGMCCVLEDYGIASKEIDCFYVWLEKDKKMINASNLNFSENPQDNSYFYNRNEQLQPDDHLFAICEHFNINVGEINDDDFYGMCYVLENYGIASKNIDCFYVWID